MDERIAELERQLEEEKRRHRPNTLFRLLERCHNSLSQAIRVETNAALTTKGDPTDPVNRLYPKRIVPWHDFPQLQQQIWSKLDRTDAFTSRSLFPSDIEIDFVVKIIRSRPINSEAFLQIFERETVDIFVKMVIEALRDDEFLRHEFGLQSQVTFYDGADQPCVHLVADERRIPVCAVEFKAPHKVMIPELVAGLHQMDLARDVINQEGGTFEYYATRLVAAVITQIFSYMIDSGVRYGYICTEEAYIFLHIPRNQSRRAGGR